MDDPYRVLGVEKTASAADIKAAYRKLAKKLHPDLNPGNKRIENQFKDATAAYEFLSDTEKRTQYDRGEIDANGQPRFAQRGPWSSQRPGRQSDRGFTFDEDSIGPEDIFQNLFGFGRSRGGGTAQMRGSDVSYRTEVDFLDAARGSKRRLTLADGKTLDVTIPPGTESGQTLRLKNQGLPGSGGGAGDALIEIIVRPHPYFRREGVNILLDVPVTLFEAVGGASIEVPTIDGWVALKIPENSTTGTQLRLKGKGIRMGGKTGDQYVKLLVMLPPKVDGDLRAAIEKSARVHPYSVRDHLK
ncbi:MAG TPA: DnaJ C-terminal domain-containing protein [Dongiaceae bacterium]|jgi:DnaJ-class molecular chaperone|nr:DnaJ C-terminal domain-containing protein [Dongiaceae bacterium]